jgi:hypothetical protein
MAQKDVSIDMSKSAIKKSANAPQKFRTITDAEFNDIRDLIAAGENEALEAKYGNVLTELSNASLQKLFTEVDIRTKELDKESGHEATKGYAVLGFSNMQDKRAMQIATMGVVSFMYHTLAKEFDDIEWERVGRPDEGSAEYVEMRRVIDAKKLVIKEFIDRLFRFNPELHLRTSAWPWKDDIAEHVLPNRMPQPKSATGTVTVDDITKQMESVSMTFSDIAENSNGTSNYMPADVRIGGVYVPVPSFDIYQSLSSYMVRNTDDFDIMINEIYGPLGELRSAIRLFETYPGTQAGLKSAESLRDSIGRNYGIDTYIVKKDNWVLLEMTREGRNNTKYNTSYALRAALDRHAEDVRLTESMRAKTVARRKTAGAKQMLRAMRKKGNGNGDEPIDPRTRESMERRRKIIADLHARNFEAGSTNLASSEYLEFAGSDRGGLRAEDIEHDEIDEMVLRGELDPQTVYENVDKDGIPLNSIVAEVLVNEGTKWGRRQIFIEEERPTELTDVEHIKVNTVANTHPPMNKAT